MTETDFKFLRHPRMTLIKQSITAIRRVDPLVYCYIIAILLGYVSLDIYTRSPSRFCSTLSADTLAIKEGTLTVYDAQSLLDKWNINLSDHKQCRSIEGHLPFNTATPKPEDAWQHMKWTGKPAQCRVKGHLIESLDDTNNFRRGYALKYTPDVEDKTHLLPWLLANQQNLNSPSRRVLLDLGGNRFDTSITWFMRMYPCDFTEVHIFEIDKNLFQFPAVPYDESSNTVPPTTVATMVKDTPSIPQWMIRRMKLYNTLVSDADDAAKNALNITRFMKETLQLAAADTVVVKMDIEGSEWPILTRWMDDPAMATIVDELFVEIHYSDPTMGGFGWLQFGEHSREDAVRLLAGLRCKGFFAHAWP